MIRNSNIDFDIGVPNSNAAHLKPLKLKGFTIAHLNIRSLVKNIDQFRLYLHEIVRKDINQNGGGVAIYLRNSINYKILK